MNDMFDSLKEIKRELKKDEKYTKTKQAKQEDKEEILKKDFNNYLKDCDIKN